MEGSCAVVQGAAKVAKMINTNSVIGNQQLAFPELIV